jgi:hypothetical protein
MSANPVFLASIKDACARLQNSDGTSFVTLLSGPTSGGRVKSLHITTDDTSAVTLQFAKTVSGVDYVLGEIPVPAGSGTNGVAVAVSGLNSTQMPALQSDGVNRFLDLANGTTLKVRAKSAITAAKYVYVSAEYGEV